MGGEGTGEWGKKRDRWVGRERTGDWGREGTANSKHWFTTSFLQGRGGGKKRKKRRRVWRWGWEAEKVRGRKMAEALLTHTMMSG